MEKLDCELPVSASTELQDDQRGHNVQWVQSSPRRADLEGAVDAARMGVKQRSFSASWGWGSIWEVLGWNRTIHT
jgi:hypothetical protein